MATATMPRTTTEVVRTGRRTDNIFFSGMAVLILVTVFVGFARTYFLAGMFRAHLPSPIIHIHGAVFSLWILLLITQTSLVSAGRTDIHRKLGLAGFGLACLMPVLGVLAATNSLSSKDTNLAERFLPRATRRSRRTIREHDAPEFRTLQILSTTLKFPSSHSCTSWLGSFFLREPL